MQRMGWTLPHTIGNLHLLWWWALEYAPTGDLTHFEPEQITYDLDLGGATPEQFLDAMIDAGFIDRIGSGPAESRPGGTMIQSGFLDKSEDVVLRIHDWPEYTARSLKPKFRKTPDRWHQVLRSYGLPIPPKRQRRTPALLGFQPPPAEAGENQHQAVPLRRDTSSSSPGYWTRLAAEELAKRRQSTPTISQPKTATPTPAPAGSTGSVEYESSGTARIDCVADAARQGVGSGCDRSQMALRAVRGISTPGSNEHSAQPAPPSDSVSTIDGNPSSDESATQPAPENAPIPKSLSGRRNFNDWWRKLQEQYKNKNCPLTAYEQTEILAMLARNPFTAVEKLQYSVVNFETSYATLLAPKNQQSANTS
jgi:hypothetical protein